MRNVRFYALVTGAMTMTAAGVLLLACGDDVEISDGGDAGFDGGGPDVVTTDSGPTDAGTDAPVVPLLDYAGLVAEGLCSSATRCCFGDANLADGGAVDGGNYNAAKCTNIYRNLGFEYSNVGAEVFDAGAVVLDQAQVQTCLAQVKALPCDMTGEKLEEVRAACFAAVVGQQAIGQPCRGSIECAKGAFCDVDGGVGGGSPKAGVTGTCAALRGQGQPCGVYNTGNLATDTETSEEACSWRGGGDTNLRCASYPADGGPTYPDRAQWTCQPTVALGQICNSTVSCEKGVCDFDDYVCKSPLTYFTGAVCTNLAKP